MTTPSVRKSPQEYAKWFLYRRVRPNLWRSRTAARLRDLTDDEFLRIAGLPPDPETAIAALDDRLRPKLLFHPRNRKEFFLGLLTNMQSYDDILDEADEVVENKFETLGSGLVGLGEQIDWHRDFKSGVSWPLLSPDRLDLLQLGSPSDVKVPWELSRFHQALWLGKAFWLTGSKVYADKFVALVDSWIAANPPGLGVNWAIAMEAAVRATNWLAGYSFFAGSSFIPAAFWVRFFKMLYIHGVFIEQNLEYAFIRGNHFLSDVAGLVVLGTVFSERPFGRRWFDWSVRQLETEMERQVYPDGVDCEKSTAYQHLVLELFYTPTILAEHSGHTFSGLYRQRLRRMFAFVGAYQRPDGSIPLFGDADDGRLLRFQRKESVNDCRSSLSVGSVMFKDPSLARAAGAFRQDALWLTGAEGFEEVRRLPVDDAAPESQIFREGGFAILRGQNAHVMADIGDIGMSGRGGHGHHDTLSFDYHAASVPLIVDSGTYAYTSDVDARQAFRGVNAHNTVQVDGREPAEFTGLWSIRSDRTDPRLEAWEVGTEATQLSASWCPDPGGHLPVRHHRKFRLHHATGVLDVVDDVRGAGDRTVIASLHLHPDAVIESETKSGYIVSAGGRSFALSVSGGDRSVQPSWYSPSYGIRTRSVVLRVRWRGALPHRLTTRIEPIEPS